MISRRKIRYPVSPALRQYLYHFDRQRDIPKIYNELRRFSGAIPYENPSGRETLWLTVMYPQEFFRELRPRLKELGMLTRDPRQHERKKYGQKGARKRFQFSKR